MKQSAQCLAYRMFNNCSMSVVGISTIIFILRTLLRNLELSSARGTYKMLSKTFFLIIPSSFPGPIAMLEGNFMHREVPLPG